MQQHGASTPELARGRVIAHVDMDAFYAAVEAQRDPALRDKPLAVVQYNPFGDLSTLKPEEPRLMPDSNGSIIAVSWSARKFGVKRNMMGQEGKKLCPELQIVQVPVAHGKADLTIYRTAGAQVVSILSRLAVCERASIDEVYLDVTEDATARLTAARKEGSRLPPAPPSFEGMHVMGAQEQLMDDALDSEGGMTGEGAGHRTVTPAEAAAVWWQRPADLWMPHEDLLAAGATVVWELRMAVHKELGYTCSAGIAHHKILAKLCSALHKPFQQTVVTASSVSGLLKDLPLSKLRGLGADFGRHVQTTLNVTTCGEMWSVPTTRLCSLFGEKRGQWLSRLVWGVDTENDIKPRLLPNQISCGKTFRGPSALSEVSSIRYWLGHLAQEVEERCSEDRRANKRMPTSITVAFTTQGNDEAPSQSFTRSCALGHAPTANAMADTATGLVKKWAAERRPGWKFISLFLTVSHFVAAPTGASTITRFLGRKATPTTTATTQATATAATRSQGHAGAATAATAASGPQSEQQQHLLQMHDSAHGMGSLGGEPHDSVCDQGADMCEKSESGDQEVTLPGAAGHTEPYSESLFGDDELSRPPCECDHSPMRPPLRECEDQGQAAHTLGVPDTGEYYNSCAADVIRTASPPSMGMQCDCDDAAGGGVGMSGSHSMQPYQSFGSMGFQGICQTGAGSPALPSMEPARPGPITDAPGAGLGTQNNHSTGHTSAHTGHTDPVTHHDNKGHTGQASQGEPGSQAYLPASLSDWLASQRTGSQHQAGPTAAHSPSHGVHGHTNHGHANSGNVVRPSDGARGVQGQGVTSTSGHSNGGDSNRWQGISADQIDPSVLAELPADIQRELRATLRLPGSAPTHASSGRGGGRGMAVGQGGSKGGGKRGPKGPPGAAGGTRPNKSIKAYFAPAADPSSGSRST